MWIVMKRTPSTVPSMRDDLRTAILTQLRSRVPAGSWIRLDAVGVSGCRRRIRLDLLSRGSTRVESSAPIFLQRQIVSRMVVFSAVFLGSSMMVLFQGGNRSP
jgi:hypothetical protein